MEWDNHDDGLGLMVIEESWGWGVAVLWFHGFDNVPAQPCWPRLGENSMTRGGVLWVCDVVNVFG